MTFHGAVGVCCDNSVVDKAAATACAVVTPTAPDLERAEESAPTKSLPHVIPNDPSVSLCTHRYKSSQPV